MGKPKGWVETNKAELTRNLKKFQYADEKTLEKLLKENENSVMLAAYTKYDPRRKAGLIPVAQVTLRSKRPAEFDAFKTARVKSLGSAAQLFDSFKITESSELMISGIRSVSTVVTFNIRTADGELLRVRSREYAIPLQNYFFQVNFTDGQDIEDCTAEFDALLRTIQIGSDPESSKP